MAAAVASCLVENRACRLAATDHEQEVGIGSIERRDAEVGESVPDGAGQRTAAGVVEQLLKPLLACGAVVEASRLHSRRPRLRVALRCRQRQ